MDVGTTFVSGRWWRHIPAGGDVYHQPDAPADNRWQRGDVVEAWYFADSELTLWAEWYRSLAEAGLPPHQGLPRDLWQWEISLPEVADITDEARLAVVAGRSSDHGRRADRARPAHASPQRSAAARASAAPRVLLSLGGRDPLPARQRGHDGVSGRLRVGPGWNGSRFRGRVGDVSGAQSVHAGGFTEQITWLGTPATELRLPTPEEQKPAGEETYRAYLAMSADINTQRWLKPGEGEDLLADERDAFEPR